MLKRHLNLKAVNHNYSEQYRSFCTNDAFRDSQLLIVYLGEICKVNRLDIQTVCRSFKLHSHRRAEAGSWLRYTADPLLVLLVFIVDVLHH